MITLLTEKRLAANKSIEDVAEHLNMDLETYVRYESIDKMPSINDWCKIAAFLGFNPIPAHVEIIYPKELKDELLQCIIKHGKKTNDYKLDMQSAELLNSIISKFQKLSAEAMDTKAFSLEECDLLRLSDLDGIAYFDIDFYGNYLVNKGIDCVNNLL